MTAAKSRPLALLLLVLSPLVVVALLWFAGGGSGEPDRVVRDTVAEQTTPQAKAMATLDDELAEPEVVRAEVEAPAADASLPAVAAPGDVVLAGTVVIEELDGSLTTDADGTLVLMLKEAGSGTSTDVPVVDGKWRTVLVAKGDGTYIKPGGRADRARAYHSRCRPRARRRVWAWWAPGCRRRRAGRTRGRGCGGRGSWRWSVGGLASIPPSPPHGREDALSQGPSLYRSGPAVSALVRRLAAAWIGPLPHSESVLQAGRSLSLQTSQP